MKIDRRRFLGAAAATTLGSTISSLPLVGEQQVATPLRVRAVIFDSLVIFDLAIVVKRADEVFPGKGAEFANLWRTRQFEYTWLRTAGEQYRDFWHVTEDALNYAATAMKFPLSGAMRDSLMSAYHELRVWPDVPDALAELHREGVRMAFLSNFTADMIRSNLKAAGLSSFFEDHLTTDRVRAFKPSPRAYEMGVDHFQCTKEEIVFAAFAPWDVAGAKWFGYRTGWINRANLPQEELNVQPDFVAHNLTPRLLLASPEMTQEPPETSVKRELVK